jgi:hypothetical protein
MLISAEKDTRAWRKRDKELESTMVGFFIGVEEDAGESIDDIIGKLSMESNAASHI